RGGAASAREQLSAGGGGEKPGRSRRLRLRLDFPSSRSSGELELAQGVVDALSDLVSDGQCTSSRSSQPRRPRAGDLGGSPLAPRLFSCAASSRAALSPS